MQDLLLSAVHEAMNHGAAGAAGAHRGWEAGVQPLLRPPRPGAPGEARSAGENGWMDDFLRDEAMVARGRQGGAPAEASAAARLHSANRSFAPHQFSVSGT